MVIDGLENNSVAGTPLAYPAGSRYNADNRLEHMAHSTRPPKTRSQQSPFSETEAFIPLEIAIHPELYTIVVEAAEQTGVSFSEAMNSLLAMGLANRDEMQTIADKKLDEKFQSENVQKEVKKYVKKEMARFLLSFLAPLLQAGKNKKLTN